MGAFNFVHGGLDRLAEGASTPAEQDLFATLLAPFDELLARRVVAEKSAAPPAHEGATKKDEGATKKDEAPAEKLRPTG